MTAGMNYAMVAFRSGAWIKVDSVENRYAKAQQIFDKTGEENEDLKEWRELHGLVGTSLVVSSRCIVRMDGGLCRRFGISLRIIIPLTKVSYITTSCAIV